MEAILVRERYKVVRVADSRENYAIDIRIDILDREMGGCLLNLYEGPLLRRYLPCFDRLESCPAFKGMFLDGESLVAAFQDCGGAPIDQVFYKGDSHSWQERLYYAGELLQAVLNLADLPPEAACPLLLSDNVRVDEINRRICLRFHIVPMEGMNAREAVFLAADQIRKILRPRFSSPGRSWPSWTSWTGAAASMWCSSTACGGSGAGRSRRLTRRWRRKILCAAGAPCSWGG